ncbi:hypothetical protein GmRootV213_16530 [Variovorax sp. V213]|uniref:SRPBCC family protein n=1 Tax=Variovorax sp. V213 TaxID=3065955 RepID=UPI0034E8E0F6
MAKPVAPAKERPSLTLRRHYPVAAEKVWRAWTDPQALKAWFGPEEIAGRVAGLPALPLRWRRPILQAPRRDDERSLP